MLITISKALATATDPIILLILTLAISLILYLKNKKSKAILLSTTSIATATTIKILKEIIKAPRPLNMLIQQTGYSFPSGHTTFAVVFFGLLIYIFAKKQHKLLTSLLAILLIIAIALSRLILRVHYPIDILAGLIIGTTILAISILIHKKLTS